MEPTYSVFSWAQFEYIGEQQAGALRPPFEITILWEKEIKTMELEKLIEKATEQIKEAARVYAHGVEDGKAEGFANW